MILAKPKSLQCNTKFEGSIYVLKVEEEGRKTPFSTGYRPQLFYKTADSACEILLPEGTKIAMPGDSLNVKFELNYPLSLVEGSRFTLREGGKTVAIGVVGKILPK
jgi:elongation factor Tu